MKNNFFYSIRWKILFLFLFSLVLSGLTLLFLLFFAMLMVKLNVPFILNLLQWLYYNVGLTVTLIVIGAVLFVIYIFALSQPSIRYLLRVIRALQHIADGNFDHRIPVRSKDELGGLAENINRMAEKIKRSIEEERRAEQTKSELITNVSHDLRTPLTSVIGYLGLIEQDRYRDEVELRYYVNIAYEKSQRLNGMINDLFEYTRTSGGMKLSLAPINLAEMLGQLAAQFRPSMEQAGMEIRLHLQDTRIMVLADGDRLVRAFENLLSNALQYGREGRYVDIAVRSEGSLVAVDVVNYGEPIPRSRLPHLFERFYRVEQSRSVHTGGSGLGLAIAKNIVSLHGGSISVASDDDRTVFVVRLSKENAGN